MIRIYVQLDPDQDAWAAEVGRRRFERGQARQRQIRGQGRSMDDDVSGARGEAALAAFFDLPFADLSMAEERRVGYDVGGYQVRSTRHQTGGLRINEGESEGLFVLAIARTAGPVWLVGWADAAHALLRGEWRQDHGRERWLRLDQSELRPMTAGLLTRIP